MHNFLTKSLLMIAILGLGAGQVDAQIGGYGTYKFLNYTNSARISAMGGSFLAVNDDDITLTLANPSLITPAMNNNLAFSYVNNPGGINYGYVAYSRTFSKKGSFVGSLQYINYGTFTGADAAGTLTGDFKAAEYALAIGWGRQLTPLFSIGANGKLIYSQLDTYNSFGIAVDVAGTFTSKDKSFSTSLMGRNIGSQIVPYLPGQYRPLPFQLQLGFSQKLKHVPLRFSQLVTNLQRWDLTYTDPTDPANIPDPITGDVKKKTGIGKFADLAMRHIVLGAELTIAKVVSLRIGYNYQRRQELKINGSAGLAGFSMGAGVHVKMFNLSYTYGNDQGGSPNRNYITLAVNLQEFIKKQ